MNSGLVRWPLFNLLSGRTNVGVSEVAGGNNLGAALIVCSARIRSPHF